MEAFLHEHGVLADFWVVGGGRRAWNWLSHFFEVFISNSINFSKQLFNGSLCSKVSLPGPTHTGMVYGAKRSTWEHTLFELKTHKCFLRVLSWKPLPRNVTLQAPCKRTQHCWPTTPNFVGCYMLRPFAHPVACWWMLLRVVAQSLKPVKGWGQTDVTTPNTLRACWQWCANGCNNCQQCWDLQCIVGRTQPISLCKPCVMSVRGPNNVGRAVQTDPTLLRYASAITEQNKWKVWLVSTFAQQHATTCNRVCKLTQHVTSNYVGSCWANSVASVCTGLKFRPTTRYRTYNYQISTRLIQIMKVTKSVALK